VTCLPEATIKKMNTVQVKNSIEIYEKLVAEEEDSKEIATMFNSLV
jgi:hypothetical protein